LSNGGNWNAAWVPSNRFDVVTGSDFSVAGHGKVKTCPSTRKKSLDHVVGLKSHTKFVARQPRLGDNYFGRAHQELVANVDGVLQQAVSSDVFSKHAHR